MDDGARIPIRPSESMQSCRRNWKSNSQFVEMIDLYLSLERRNPMKVRDTLGLATSPVTWVALVRISLASAVVSGLLMMTAQASPFRAACVKVDISPRESQWMASYGPRRSEGVQDRIFHRILAMDDRFIRNGFARL